MSAKKYIAGWLLIPAAITWIAPIIFGTAVYQHSVELKDMWPRITDQLDLWLFAVPKAWFVLLFFGSLGSLCLLVRHSPLYPKLSTVWALLFVSTLLVVALLNAVFFKETPDRDDALIMLGLFGASICWWAYMKYSARVRATFRPS